MSLSKKGKWQEALPWYPRRKIHNLCTFYLHKISKSHKHWPHAAERIHFGAVVFPIMESLMAPLCRKRRTKHHPWPSLEAQSNNEHPQQSWRESASSRAGQYPLLHGTLTPLLAGPPVTFPPRKGVPRQSQTWASLGTHDPHPRDQRLQVWYLHLLPPGPGPSQSDAGSLPSTSFNLPTRSSQSREQDRQVNRQRQREVGT